MTFDELIEKVRKIAASKDVSDKDFLAVQVNITGKNSGVFYVEIKDHKEEIKKTIGGLRFCSVIEWENAA